jgi:flavin-dependent dehydrogenase
MDADTIIVGAGPAGLSTGLFLQQAAPNLARRTLILEQAHHPRPKLCAGGLLPSVDVYLRLLGLDPDAIPSAPVREIVLQFEQRTAVIRRLPLVFRTVRREDFDAWLARCARERGIQIQEGVRVRRVERREGWMVAVTDRGPLCAQAIVGADGSKSVVRSAIVGGAEPKHLARLIEVRCAGAARRSPDQANFDFSHIPAGVQGYAWDFPSPGIGDNLRTWGVYDSRIRSGRPHPSLKPFLDESLRLDNGQARDLGVQGHPLRWFHPRAVLSAPRVLLVGDAAGTDPVVGEGISFALGYGQVAAAALQDAFERDDFSFAGYRRQVRRHRIGRFLMRRYVAAVLLYGLQSRTAYRLVWPALGLLARALFVDWGDRRAARTG